MIYLAHIRTAFELSNGTSGSPRMHRDLVDDGHSIGRRRVSRLMRENRLTARQKRWFKRTTDSQHTWPVAPKLIDQNFRAERTGQKWGADISYIWTAEGWLYLAVIVDLFSRRVVGWATNDRLQQDLVLHALKRAVVSRRPSAGLIHHSPSRDISFGNTLPGSGSRQSVFLNRPSGGASKTGLPDLDERQGQLL